MRGGPQHSEHAGGWKVGGAGRQWRLAELQRRWSGAVSDAVARWRSGKYQESRHFRRRERTVDCQIYNSKLMSVITLLARFHPLHASPLHSCEVYTPTTHLGLLV